MEQAFQAARSIQPVYVTEKLQEALGETQHHVVNINS